MVGDDAVQMLYPMIGGYIIELVVNANGRVFAFDFKRYHWIPPLPDISIALAKSSIRSRQRETETGGVIWQEKSGDKNSDAIFSRFKRAQ